MLTLALLFTSLQLFALFGAGLPETWQPYRELKHPQDPPLQKNPGDLNPDPPDPPDPGDSTAGFTDLSTTTVGLDEELLLEELEEEDYLHAYHEFGHDDDEVRFLVIKTQDTRRERVIKEGPEPVLPEPGRAFPYILAAAAGVVLIVLLVTFLAMREWTKPDGFEPVEEEGDALADPNDTVGGPNPRPERGSSLEAALNVFAEEDDSSQLTQSNILDSPQISQVEPHGGYTSTQAALLGEADYSSEGRVVEPRAVAAPRPVRPNSVSVVSETSDNENVLLKVGSPDVTAAETPEPPEPELEPLEENDECTLLQPSRLGEHVHDATGPECSALLENTS